MDITNTGPVTVGAKSRLERVTDSALYQALALAGIVFLAVVIRAYKIGEWGVWIDEVFETTYALEAVANFPDFRRLSLFLTGATLNLFGVSEWSGRLAPAAIGIVSIPILYVPMRRMFGVSVALLAALLLAISPWHLEWSQSIRFYTLLLLFYNLALFFFFFAMERNSRGYLALSVLFLGLAFLERKMALFYVPIVVTYLAGIFIFRMERPRGLNRFNLLLMASPAILFGIYQGVVILTGGTPFYADFLAEFIGHRHNPVRVLFSVIYDVGQPIFLMALAGGAYLLFHRSRAGLFLLLSAMVPLTMVVMMAPFTQTFSRYVFSTLPSWLLLAALAVKTLLEQTQKNTRLLALGVLVVLVAHSLSQDLLYFGYQNGNRPNWKAAYHTVQANWQEGDQVVTTRTPVGEYYLGQPVIWTQGLYPDEVEAMGRRTWFVIDNRTGFVAPALADFLATDTRLLGVHDVVVPGKTMEMRVYLYTPPGP